MRRLVRAAAALLLAAQPPQAQAQDHRAHHGHGAAEPDRPATAEQAPPSPPPVDHGGMDHTAMDHGMMDHSMMDHAMGQGDMDHAAMAETPSPPVAASGPPRAADAIWGADAMAASRRELQKMHGDFPLFWFQADRAEVQVRSGANGYLWDVQGYYGEPTRRYWFKSEGEGMFGKAIADAEVQALYSQAITPFFDIQAGIRQDVAGSGTTHAVVGVQGIAPHMFEVDAALFLSHRGDVTARIEAEVDQRITQRLILQPRAEVNLAAQDIPQLGIGAGIDAAELGVRLRYEIIREFAPYIGIEQRWRVGRGARFARAAGDDPASTSIVAGIRFWF